MIYGFGFGRFIYLWCINWSCSHRPLSKLACWNNLSEKPQSVLTRKKKSPDIGVSAATPLLPACNHLPKFPPWGTLKWNFLHQAVWQPKIFATFAFFHCAHTFGRWKNKNGLCFHGCISFWKASHFENVDMMKKKASTVENIAKKYRPSHLDLSKRKYVNTVA